MRFGNTPFLPHVRGLMLAVLIAGTASDAALAQGVVPGTGTKLAEETFEDAEWAFNVNWPKSSYNLDKRVREPVGYSNNGAVYESRKRGGPEVMKRIETPAGGLSGSTGALYMRSLYTGVPGRRSFKTQQDDAMLNFSEQTNGAIPVSSYPSAVVRVYLPPFDQWEACSGTSFGMRTCVTGVGPDEPEEGEKPKFERRGLFGLFRGGPKDPMKKRVRDKFYPSFFVQFNSKANGHEKDSAVLVIRGNDSYQDYPTKEITETGWWTLGISFSPEGRAHYYASPGVDDLTKEDHIASHYPQSVRVEYFNSFYFNVCNQDRGQWSTPWVVDDPAVYVYRAYRHAQR